MERIRRPEDSAEISWLHGMKIIDTHHYIDRVIERNKIKEEQVEALLTASLDWLKSHSHFFNKSGDFLFYKKSVHQGVVVDWRFDEKAPSDKVRSMVLVSFLPRNKSYAKPGTKRVVMEAYCYAGRRPVWSKGFIDMFTYLLESCKEGKRSLTEARHDRRVRKSFFIGRIKLDEGVTLKYILCENRLWDILNYHAVEL